jgi:pyruvate/2-oxoglutarate dehydrogenase complex dihydrolipoamide acyltransferase (E2) component
VAVIETDKVNVDIRSPHTGVIKKYYAAEGDTVQVDADFFDIDTDAKGGAAPAQTAAPAKEAPPAAAPKKVTKILLLINNSGGA